MESAQRCCFLVTPVYQESTRACLPTDTVSTSIPSCFKAGPKLSLPSITPMLPVVVAGCATILSAAAAGQYISCQHMAVSSPCWQTGFCVTWNLAHHPVQKLSLAEPKWPSLRHNAQLLHSQSSLLYSSMRHNCAFCLFS